MKRIFTFVASFAFIGFAYAQNTFPATGNVGIGTTSPQNRLQVVGGGISVNGTNSLRGINGFFNAIELLSAHHAAILFNPGQETQQMFGFHTNGSMYWGGAAYAMVLTKTGDLRVNNSLAVGSGLKAGSKMSVNGKLSAKEVEVTTSNWPDYVFQRDYELMPLDSLERFITQRGHLPDIPTAEEVDKNGVQLGDMINKLLKKNEELTLHLIEKNKQLDELERRVKLLEKSQ